MSKCGARPRHLTRLGGWHKRRPRADFGQGALRAASDSIAPPPGMGGPLAGGGPAASLALLSRADIDLSRGFAASGLPMSAVQVGALVEMAEAEVTVCSHLLFLSALAATPAEPLLEPLEVPRIRL